MTTHVPVPMAVRGTLGLCLMQAAMADTQASLTPIAVYTPRWVDSHGGCEEVDAIGLAVAGHT